MSADRTTLAVPSGISRRRLAAIRRCLGMPVRSVAVNDEGADNLVAEVNGAWIFRFPRDARVRRILRIERAFLAELAPFSPVPVPAYRFGDDRFGVFGVYPRIPGEGLTPAWLATLGAPARRDLARRLAGFLTALHGFPLERARAIGVPEHWHEWHAWAAGTFTAAVAPLLSPGARAAALALLDAHAAMMIRQPDRPVVVHGDFAPGDHVLVDRERAEITGVIDFTDLMIESRTRDFIGLLRDFGRAFLDEVLAGYGGGIEADFEPRLRLQVGAHGLLDAVYLLEPGKDAELADKLAEIEQGGHLRR